MFDKYKNSDGSYDGISLFSEMTGLSKEEISWTWKRMKELQEQGIEKGKRKEIVSKEAKTKPWIKK